MRSRRAELETSYGTRYQRFSRVAIGIVGDEAGARDAVQDGFVLALKSTNGFSGEGSFEGWVWRIVVNAGFSFGIDPYRPSRPYLAIRANELGWP